MEINKYDFIQGDCLEKLKGQKDKSIDLVVTSPPYNIGLKYNKYNDKKYITEFVLIELMQYLNIQVLIKNILSPVNITIQKIY